MATQHTTHWLDTVLAVPSIGVRFEPDFAGAFRLPEIVLTSLQKRKVVSGALNIEQSSPIHYSLRLPTGLLFTLRPDSIVIEFKYPRTQKETPGALPAFEFIEPVSYTDKLDELRNESCELLSDIADHQRLKINRIGFMAFASLDKKFSPPGVRYILDHLGKPWNRPLTKSDTTLLVTLHEDEKQRDQCHHIVRYDDLGKPDDLEFILDWQRVFQEHIGSKPTQIRETINDCAKLALAYFQSVAEKNFGAT